MTSLDISGPASQLLLQKKLFKSIDMCNLEDQVYAKYVYPFRHNSIDEMAKSWLKYRREKLKKA